METFEGRRRRQWSSMEKQVRQRDVQKVEEDDKKKLEKVNGLCSYVTKFKKNDDMIISFFLTTMRFNKN